MRLIISAIALGTLFASCRDACPVATPTMPTATAIAPGDTCSPTRRMAWSHYVPWYDPSCTAHTARGFWDQPSAATMPDLAMEYAAARAAGIDGFFVDVVGGPRPKATSFVDAVADMLHAAEGSPFLVAPCLDVCHPDLAWQVEEIARMMKRFGAHPNYPRINGRPVIATYGATGRTPSQWQAIRDGLRAVGLDPYFLCDLGGGFSVTSDAEVAAYAKVFDQLYVFAAYPHRPAADQPALSTAERFDRLGRACAAAGRSWMPTLWPGYLGGWLNGRNDFHQPFRCLDVLWESAQALDPKRDAWVHLCTWNDHDETTLAASAIGGPGKLALCQAALARWRSEPLPAGPARVLAAYRREELIGSDLRIEIASLPGADGGELAVDGWLQDSTGVHLAELPRRTLLGTRWDRAEWRVPTAAMGRAAAWEPVLTVHRGTTSDTPVRLPAILPATGWLENACTVAMPLDAIAPGQARLSVDASGTARLDTTTSAAVRSATLWRNDRCVALLQPATAAAPEALLHLAIPAHRTHRLRLSISAGSLIYADARARVARDSWQATGLDIRHKHDWAPLFVTIATTTDTVITARIDEQPAVTLDRAALSAGEQVVLGSPVAASVMLAGFDPRGVAAVADAQAYAITLADRPGRPGDRLCVRVELADGRVLWSPVVTPWAGEARPVTVITTPLSLDATADFSGTIGETGWFSDIGASTVQAVTVPVHPAALRAARWRLTPGGADLTGDRPIAALRQPTWHNHLASDGPDGHSCLQLDGTQAFNLPSRVWPLGPCTIAISLRPADPPGSEQRIIGRGGWATGMQLKLRADGRVEAWRDGHATTAASVLGDRPLVAGIWARIHLTYDGERLHLWQDGRLCGEAAAPTVQIHGNCTASLGAAKNGFRGSLGDLDVRSWVVEPEAAARGVQ